MVVNININYGRPIETRNPTTLTAQVTHRGTRKVIIRQTVTGDDGTAHADGDVTAMFVDKNKKAVPVPDYLQKMLR